MNFRISVFLLSIAIIISAADAKPTPNFVLGFPGSWLWYDYPYYYHTHYASYEYPIYTYNDDGTTKVTYTRVVT